MRPTKLKIGNKLLIRPALGTRSRIGFFVRRETACGGRKVVNYVRFPDYAGLNGPGDDGTREMSDYDLSRRGEYA
ncbi:MAG: hypothetical protein KZQ89_01545 [Candidatus Thiodiazotropha sp. (ex Lucinoma kastoroae)]|nr:hypothetical protein [Candidatus Thiodiazotropha sp. (ex Lucinoma kastoroae)]